MWNKTVLMNMYWDVIAYLLLAGEGRTLQKTSRVEMVFEGPKEVQDHGTEVRDRTTEFIR